MDGYYCCTMLYTVVEITEHYHFKVKEVYCHEMQQLAHEIKMRMKMGKRNENKDTFFS